MNENIILSGTELCKQFGATVAINNISFSLEKGDFLGLVGENGAGKTSYSRLLKWAFFSRSEEKILPTLKQLQDNRYVVFKVQSGEYTFTTPLKQNQCK